MTAMSADWSVETVDIGHESLPSRVRRPLDSARLLGALTGAALVVVVFAAAVETTRGLAADLRSGNVGVPGWLVELVSVLSALAGLVLIVVLLGSLAVRGRLLAAVELLVSGAFGAILALGAGRWIRDLATERVVIAFEPVGADVANPVPSYPAFLVALVSVRGWPSRTWSRRLVVFAVVGGSLAGIFAGETSLPAALLAILLGRAAGIAVRLSIGVPVDRPDARRLAVILAGLGWPPVSMRPVPSDGARRYIAKTPRGDLELLVLDRDREGAGLLSRTWTSLRARVEIVPRQSLTIRADTDQRALVAYAFAVAGVRSPSLRICMQVDSDTMLLAYDDVPGRPLTRVEVTDKLQADVWQQIKAMHDSGLAHRRLTSAAIRVDGEGRPWLIDRSGGEVAASDLAQITDIVQMLVELSLLTNPSRAVDAAVSVLGRDAVGRAFPLLQPIVLTRRTRRALQGRAELMSELRSKILERAEPSTEEVVLERFRPRTVLSAASLVVAAYLISSQLAGVDLLGLAAGVRPGWVGLAVLAMAVTFLADPPALLSFVRQRVSYWRAIGAQFALSFVKLVMPSAIGNAALDFRLLTKSGVPAPVATAAAAASQAIAVIVTIPLLLVLGVMTGRAASAGLTPSPTALLFVVVVIAAPGLLSLSPPIRLRARTVWDGFARGGLASLLDALQDPRRLLMATGSNLAVTMSFVGCFYCCIRALGGDVSFALLAFVWLTGNAVGTAVPTPGGLGAVEAALTAGLTTGGVPGAIAVSSVLLFRLVSFWLPIPFGYLAWVRMQRAGTL